MTLRFRLIAENSVEYLIRVSLIRLGRKYMESTTMYNVYTQSEIVSTTCRFYYMYTKY